MSRAFISDSDGDFMEDDVPEAKYPLPEGVKNYMTPEGADRLRKERSSLADVERPALVARLAQNVTGEGGTEKERVLGDRRRLREIDRRIAYLTKLLERLEVVDPESQDQTRVLFGARVTVLENGHTEKSYRIVGFEESDPSSGDISFLSPIARTLTSKKVGDSVTLRIPAGEVNLKVVRIEY